MDILTVQLFMHKQLVKKFPLQCLVIKV